jgi:hypothetical protein
MLSNVTQLFTGNGRDAKSQSSSTTSKFLKALFQLSDVSEWIVKNWWHLIIQFLELADGSSAKIEK